MGVPQRKIEFFDKRKSFIGIKAKPVDHQFIPHVHLIKPREFKPIEDVLPCYESAVIDDLNTVFLKNRMIHFQFGKEIYSFQFLPVPESCSPQVAITLQSGNHYFWLGMDNPYIIDLIDGEHSDKLPQDIKCAFLESALEPLLDHFDKWAGVKTHIREVSLDNTAKNYGQNLSFQLVRRRDQLKINGQMSFAQTGLNWLAHLYRNASDQPAIDVDELVVPAGFIIGQTNLSLSDLQTLEMNDIIVMDRCSFHKNSQQCQIRFTSNICWEGVLNNNIVTIGKFIGETMSDQETKKDDKTKASEQEIVANIDEIDVELIFELGRKQVGIGELKKLKSGYTFDLEKELKQAIVVRANGKKIGHGEIVRIDDRVGVKITNIGLKQITL